MVNKTMICGKLVDVKLNPGAGTTKVPEEDMDEEQKEALKDIPRNYGKKSIKNK